MTNPVSADYYTWENLATTAQYYVNPSGYGPDDACIWGSSGTNLGNWAPVNIGTGVGSGGITYISVFPNSPTNPDGVLDFDIKITGDYNGDCSYTGGKYYSDGVESATGCTVSSCYFLRSISDNAQVAVPVGGSATFELYSS